MTTREKAHRLLDELPESEVAPVVEFIASRRRGEANGASKRAPRPRLGLGRSTDGLSAAETAGEPVAEVEPTFAGTGRAVKEMLRKNRPDPEWAAELRELRDAVGLAPERWRD